MTFVQRLAYEAVFRLYARDGRVTVQGVADELDRCKATTWFHLDALRRKGRICWDVGRPGSIRPLPTPRPVAWVPLLSIEAK